MSDLLPPNTTALERAAAEALAELERVPVPLRTLMSPDDCPLHLLPYLAWALSVDRWDMAWSESARRGVVRAAYYVHARKGTLSALRRVVEPLGYLLEIDEWWQVNPEGPPGTFALRIGVNQQGITNEIYAELERLIDDAKPLTRHIVNLDVAGETRGKFYVGAAFYDGDVTAVMPFIARESEVAGAMYMGAATDSIDATTVYPNR